MRKLYFVVLMSLICSVGHSQTISYTTLASTYSQNFDALPSSGTFTFAANGPFEITNANNFGATVSGWYVERYSGTTQNISWVVGTGSGTAGAAYSFGSAAASDRALGSLASGGKMHRFGALITNNTGSTINKFTISFYTEMWRRGDFASGNINNFEYKVGATGINDVTGFVAASNLNMVTPNIGATNNAAADGNLAANRVLVSFTVGGITLGNGQVLAIRWVDPNDTGNDDGLALDDFTFSADVQTITPYYSKAAGNLTDVATWGTNTNGTGTSPTDFITDGQIFNVVNRVTTTLDANWTVSGSGSKVIVGEGTTGTELILPNTAALTGTVDVTNLSTLRLENSTLPTFGTLATGSTVNYAQTASPYVVPTSTTYYNLSISNGIKTLAGGTITINGNLILDGVSDFNGSSPSFTTIALSGNFTMTNGATFAASPAGDGNRLTLNCVSTGATQILSGGSFLLFRLQTTVASAAALNINLGLNANLQIGNATSGTLNLIGASQTLSLTGNNTVSLYAAGRIQASNQGTISGNSSSAFIVNSNALATTIGSIGFTPGFQQLGTLTMIAATTGDNTLTLTSPLTITTALNLTAGFINIGANNLTVTGIATGGSSGSFVQTNSTGTLTINGVGAGPIVFPIGSTTYNPVTLANGSSNNFSARVADGILDPSGAIPVDAVLRTWYIGANVNTAGVTVTYQYATADCSPGASAQPLTMQIMQSDYTTWHLSAGNGAIAAIGPAPWTVTSAATLNISNSLIPYTLGVSGTAILAVDYFITAKAQKQNNNALISWTVGNAAGVNNFEVQRAVGNGAYQTIGTVAASSGQVNYQFTDFATDKGTNLYRIRVNRTAGGVRYSNTVAVINGSNGLLITGLWPNPAQDKAQLTLSTAKAGAIRFEIYGLNGVMVKSWTAAAAEGTNVMTIPTGDLRAGVYQLVATGQEARSVFRFIRQ